jgi:hypothetical protein
MFPIFLSLTYFPALSRVECLPLGVSIVPRADAVETVTLPRNPPLDDYQSNFSQITVSCNNIGIQQQNCNIASLPPTTLLRRFLMQNGMSFEVPEAADLLVIYVKLSLEDLPWHRLRRNAHGQCGLSEIGEIIKLKRPNLSADVHASLYNQNTSNHSTRICKWHLICFDAG